MTIPSIFHRLTEHLYFPSESKRVWEQTLSEAYQKQKIQLQQELEAPPDGDEQSVQVYQQDRKTRLAAVEAAMTPLEHTKDRGLTGAQVRSLLLDHIAPYFRDLNALAYCLNDAPDSIKVYEDDLYLQVLSRLTLAEQVKQIEALSDELLKTMLKGAVNKFRSLSPESALLNTSRVLIQTATYELIRRYSKRARTKEYTETQHQNWLATKKEDEPRLTFAQWVKIQHMNDYGVWLKQVQNLIPDIGDSIVFDTLAEYQHPNKKRSIDDEIQAVHDKFLQGSALDWTISEDVACFHQEQALYRHLHFGAAERKSYAQTFLTNLKVLALQPARLVEAVRFTTNNPNYVHWTSGLLIRQRQLNKTLEIPSDPKKVAKDRFDEICDAVSKDIRSKFFPLDIRVVDTKDKPLKDKMIKVYQHNRELQVQYKIGEEIKSFSVTLDSLSISDEQHREQIKALIQQKIDENGDDIVVTEERKNVKEVERLLRAKLEEAQQRPLLTIDGRGELQFEFLYLNLPFVLNKPGTQNYSDLKSLKQVSSEFRSVKGTAVEIRTRIKTERAELEKNIGENKHRITDLNTQSSPPSLSEAIQLEKDNSMFVLQLTWLDSMEKGLNNALLEQSQLLSHFTEEEKILIGKLLILSKEPSLSGYKRIFQVLRLLNVVTFDKVKELQQQLHDSNLNSEVESAISTLRNQVPVFRLSQESQTGNAELLKKLDTVQKKLLINTMDEKQGVEAIFLLFKEEYTSEALKLYGITDSSHLERDLKALAENVVRVMARAARGESLVSIEEQVDYESLLGLITTELKAKTGETEIDFKQLEFKVKHQNFASQKETTCFVKYKNVGYQLSIQPKESLALPYSIIKREGEEDVIFSYGGTRGIEVITPEIERIYPRAEPKRGFGGVRLIGTGQYGATKLRERMGKGDVHLVKKGYPSQYESRFLYAPGLSKEKCQTDVTSKNQSYYYLVREGLYYFDHNAHRSEKVATLTLEQRKKLMGELGLPLKKTDIALSSEQRKIIFDLTQHRPSDLSVFKEKTTLPPDQRRLVSRDDSMIDQEALINTLYGGGRNTRLHKERDKYRLVQQTIFSVTNPEVYYSEQAFVRGESDHDTVKAQLVHFQPYEESFHNPTTRHSFDPQGYAKTFQLAQGLLRETQRLEQLGFHHNDIKPENFRYIVEPDGTLTLKLIDFGTASFETRDFEALFKQKKMPDQKQQTDKEYLQNLYQSLFGEKVELTTVTDTECVGKNGFYFKKGTDGTILFGRVARLQTNYGDFHSTLFYLSPKTRSTPVGTPFLAQPQDDGLDNWALMVLNFGLCQVEDVLARSKGRDIDRYFIPGILESDGKNPPSLKIGSNFNGNFLDADSALKISGTGLMFVPTTVQEGEPFHIVRRMLKLRADLDEDSSLHSDLKTQLKNELEAQLNAIIQQVASGVPWTKEEQIERIAQIEGIFDDYQNALTASVKLSKEKEFQRVLVRADKTPRLSDLPADDLRTLLTYPSTKNQKNDVVNLLKSKQLDWDAIDAIFFKPEAGNLILSIVGVGQEEIFNQILSSMDTVEHARQTMQQNLLRGRFDEEGLMAMALERGMTSSFEKMLAALSTVGVDQEALLLMLINPTTHPTADLEIGYGWNLSLLERVILNDNPEPLNSILLILSKASLSESNKALLKNKILEALYLTAQLGQVEAFNAIFDHYSKNKTSTPILPSELLNYQPDSTSDQLKQVLTRDARTESLLRKFFLEQSDQALIKNFLFATTPAPLLIAIRNQNIPGLTHIINLARGQFDSSEQKDNDLDRFLGAVDEGGKSALYYFLQNQDVEGFTKFYRFMEEVAGKEKAYERLQNYLAAIDPVDSIQYYLDSLSASPLHVAEACAGLGRIMDLICPIATHDREKEEQDSVQILFRHGKWLVQQAAQLENHEAIRTLLLHRVGFTSKKLQKDLLNHLADLTQVATTKDFFKNLADDQSLRRNRSSDVLPINEESPASQRSGHSANSAAPSSAVSDEEDNKERVIEISDKEQAIAKAFSLAGDEFLFQYGFYQLKQYPVQDLLTWWEQHDVLDQPIFAEATPRELMMFLKGVMRYLNASDGSIILKDNCLRRLNDQYAQILSESMLEFIGKEISFLESIIVMYKQEEVPDRFKYLRDDTIRAHKERVAELKIIQARLQAKEELNTSAHTEATTSLVTQQETFLKTLEEYQQSALELQETMYAAQLQRVYDEIKRLQEENKKIADLHEEVFIALRSKENEHQRDLAGFQAQNKKNEDRIDQLTAELEALQQRDRMSQVIIAGTDIHFAEAYQEFQSRSTALQSEFQIKLDSIKTAYEKATQHIHELQSNLDDEEVRGRQLAQELQAAQSENALARGLLDLNIARIDASQKRVRDLKRQRDEEKTRSQGLLSELRVLSDQSKMAQQRGDAIIQQLRAELLAQQTAHQERVRVLEEAFSLKEQNRDDIERALRAKMEQITATTAVQLQMNRGEQARHDQQVQVLESQVSDLSERLRKTESDQSEYEQLKTLHSQLSRNLDEARETNRLLDEENKTLQGKISTLRATLVHMNRQQRTDHVHWSQLTDAFAKWNEAQNDLVLAAMSQKTKLLVDEQSKIFDHRVNELRQVLNDEIATHRNNVATVEQTITEAKKHLDELERQVVALKEEKELSDQDKTSLLSQLKTTKLHLAESRSTQAEQFSRLKATLDERDKLKAEVQEIAHTLPLEKGTARDQAQSIRDKYVRSKRLLEEKNALLASLQQSIQSLGSQLGVSQSGGEDVASFAERVITEASKRELNQNDRINDLQDRIRDLERQLTPMSEENERLKTQLKELDGQLKNKQPKARAKKVQQLKRQNVELQTQIQALTREKETLHQLVDHVAESTSITQNEDESYPAYVERVKQSVSTQKDTVLVQLDEIKSHAARVSNLERKVEQDRADYYKEMAELQDKLTRSESTNRTLDHYRQKFDELNRTLEGYISQLAQATNLSQDEDEMPDKYVERVTKEIASRSSLATNEISRLMEVIRTAQLDLDDLRRTFDEHIFDLKSARTEAYARINELERQVVAHQRDAANKQNEIDRIGHRLEELSEETYAEGPDSDDSVYNQELERLSRLAQELESRINDLSALEQLMMERINALDHLEPDHGRKEGANERVQRTPDDSQILLASALQHIRNLARGAGISDVMPGEEITAYAKRVFETLRERAREQNRQIGVLQEEIHQLRTARLPIKLAAAQTEDELMPTNNPITLTVRFPELEHTQASLLEDGAAIADPNVHESDAGAGAPDPSVSESPEPSSRRVEGHRRVRFSDQNLDPENEAMPGSVPTYAGGEATLGHEPHRSSPPRRRERDAGPPSPPPGPPPALLVGDGGHPSTVALPAANPAGAASLAGSATYQGAAAPPLPPGPLPSLLVGDGGLPSLPAGAPAQHATAVPPPPPAGPPPSLLVGAGGPPTVALPAGAPAQHATAVPPPPPAGPPPSLLVGAGGPPTVALPAGASAANPAAAAPPPPPAGPPPSLLVGAGGPPTVALPAGASAANPAAAAPPPPPTLLQLLSPIQQINNIVLLRHVLKEVKNKNEELLRIEAKQENVTQEYNLCSAQYQRIQQSLAQLTPLAAAALSNTDPRKASFYEKLKVERKMKKLWAHRERINKKFETTYAALKSEAHALGINAQSLDLVLSSYPQQRSFWEQDFTTAVTTQLDTVRNQNINAGSTATYEDLVENATRLLDQNVQLRTSLGRFTRQKDWWKVRGQPNLNKFLEAHQKGQPYEFLNPAFQASAKKQALEIEKDLKEINEGTQTVYHLLLARKYALEEELEVLEQVVTPAATAATAAPTLSEDEIEKVKKLMQKIEKELAKVGDELESVDRMDKHLNGDPNSTIPRLQEGLFVSLEKAKDQDAQLQWAKFESSYEDLSSDERAEYVKKNGEYEYTAHQYTQTTANTAMRHGYSASIVEGIPEGHFRAHRLADVTSQTIYARVIEEQVVGSTEDKPKCQLTVIKFPKLADYTNNSNPEQAFHEHCVETALMIASLQLSQLATPPTKDDPITIVASSEVEARYLAAAYLALGSKSGQYKFGKEALNVTCTAPNFSLSTSSDWSKFGVGRVYNSGFYKEFLNTGKVGALQLEIEAMSKEKYSHKEYKEVMAKMRFGALSASRDVERNEEFKEIDRKNPYRK